MIFCSCHRVREEELVELIESRGCANLDELEVLTPAGTSCGGCVGNLVRLIDQHKKSGSNSSVQDLKPDQAETLAGFRNVKT